MNSGRWLLAGLVLLGGCQATKDAFHGREPVFDLSLAGDAWRIEDVNGGGVIDDAPLSLAFEAGAAGSDGRVSGQAGCNRFSGSWFQQGGVVRFGPLAATRMMCAPELMALEAKLLGTLAAASTVRFDASGAATLVTPDGRLLKLRRASAPNP